MNLSVLSGSMCCTGPVPSFGSVGCFINAWAGGHPVEAPGNRCTVSVKVVCNCRSCTVYCFWLQGGHSVQLHFTNYGWCAGRLE